MYSEKDLPAISARSAAILSVSALLYIMSYLHVDGIISIFCIEPYMFSFRCYHLAVFVVVGYEFAMYRLRGTMHFHRTGIMKSTDSRLRPCCRISSLTSLDKIAYTLLYVIPFYLTAATRPSPLLSRDAPSVIRARIRAVTLSGIISSIATIYIIVTFGKATHLGSLRLLGWWPIAPLEIVKSLVLTALLFAGPLFEKGFAEGEWKGWIRGRRISETLSSWIGWRNYVAVLCSIHTLEMIANSASVGPYNRRTRLPLSPCPSPPARSRLPHPYHLSHSPILRHSAHPPLLRVHPHAPTYALATRTTSFVGAICVYDCVRLVCHLSLPTHGIPAGSGAGA